MNELTSESVKAILDSLAASLQIPVETLFEVFIKQAAIVGTISTIAAIIPSIIFIILYKKFQESKKVLHEIDSHNCSDIFEASNRVSGYGFFTLFSLGGAMILTPFFLYQSITAFQNPEYWAITKIIGLL